jgi:hypothetical protein
MSKILSFLAVSTLALGLGGCPAGDSICAQFCDTQDECSGTTVAENCKAGYAVLSGAAAADQEETCQIALDALDDTCAGD